MLCSCFIFTLNSSGVENYHFENEEKILDDPTILWLQNLFSQKEVHPFPWACLLVQRNPSKFRAALYSFCQCLCCALGLCRKAKRVVQEERDERIAKISVLEVTRALKETSVAGLQCESMGVNIDSLALLQNQSRLLKCEYWELLSWSFKWQSHLAAGWHRLSDAVTQGSFRVSVTQKRKECKNLLCWYK